MYYRDVLHISNLTSMSVQLMSSHIKWLWLQIVNEQRYVIKEVKKSKWFDCKRLFDIVWEEEVVSLVATEKIQTLGCGCANEKETDIVIKKWNKKGINITKKYIEILQELERKEMKWTNAYTCWDIGTYRQLLKNIQKCWLYMRY